MLMCNRARMSYKHRYICWLCFLPCNYNEFRIYWMNNILREGKKQIFILKYLEDLFHIKTETINMHCKINDKAFLGYVNNVVMHILFGWQHICPNFAVFSIVYIWCLPSKRLLKTNIWKLKLKPHKINYCKNTNAVILLLLIFIQKWEILGKWVSR